MARLTVEDCLKNVKNRFELVLKASERARKLSQGANPFVDWDNDKPTVVALREIAIGMLKKSSENNNIFINKNKEHMASIDASKNQTQLDDKDDNKIQEMANILQAESSHINDSDKAITDTDDTKKQGTD